MKHKPKGSNQEKKFKETKGRYLVAVPLIPLKQKNKKEKKRNILTLVVRVFLFFFFISLVSSSFLGSSHFWISSTNPSRPFKKKKMELKQKE